MTGSQHMPALIICSNNPNFLRPNALNLWPQDVPWTETPHSQGQRMAADPAQLFTHRRTSSSPTRELPRMLSYLSRRYFYTSLFLPGQMKKKEVEVGGFVSLIYKMDMITIFSPCSSEKQICKTLSMMIDTSGPWKLLLAVLSLLV